MWCRTSGANTSASAPACRLATSTRSETRPRWAPSPGRRLQPALPGHGACSSLGSGVGGAEASTRLLGMRPRRRVCRARGPMALPAGRSESLPCSLEPPCPAGALATGVKGDFPRGPGKRALGGQVRAWCRDPAVISSSPLSRAGLAVGEADPGGNPLTHPGHHGQAWAPPQRREGEGQGQGSAQGEARPGPAPQGQDGRLAEQDRYPAPEETGSPRYPAPCAMRPLCPKGAHLLAPMRRPIPIDFRAGTGLLSIALDPAPPSTRSMPQLQRHRPGRSPA